MKVTLVRPGCLGVGRPVGRRGVEEAGPSPAADEAAVAEAAGLGWNRPARRGPGTPRVKGVIGGNGHGRPVR